MVRKGVASGDWFFERVEGTGTAFGLETERCVHSEQTRYQRIDIYQTRTFGYLMVIDGCTMVSTRDNFLYHEMMAHPVLNAHAAPRNVVIIGGGDCGTLNEVLKHPEVEKAVQVEIDERVTRLSERFFPELCERNGDSRAALIFGDGIQWMKEASGSTVDIVIIDSTDPVGPAQGLFGVEFYEECRRVLRPDGLLVHQSESPLLHLELIAAMQGCMKRSGFFRTHLLNFPQPIYPSGWWSASIAQKSTDSLIERLDQAAIAALKTRFYSAEIHRACFALPPFVADALA